MALIFLNSSILLRYLYGNHKITCRTQISSTFQNVCRVLMGKPEGKRPLERPRRRWKDGIKMNLREIGWGVWSGFTWLRIGIFVGLL
jgi:hypothetical protein